MVQKRTFRKKRGKKIVNISREEIENATDEYLKNGGKITKLQNDKDREMPNYSWR